jgi:hypothetical protein
MTLAAHEHHRTVQYRLIAGFPLILAATLIVCFVLILHPVILVIIHEHDARMSDLYIEYVIAAAVIDLIICAILLSLMVVLEACNQRRSRKLYLKYLPSHVENNEKQPLQQHTHSDWSKEKESFLFGRYLFSSGIFANRIPGHTGHPIVSKYNLDSKRYNCIQPDSKLWKLFAITSKSEHEKVDWIYKPNSLRLVDWRIALIIPAFVGTVLLGLIGISVWYKLAPAFSVLVALLFIILAFMSAHSIVRMLTLRYMVTDQRVAVFYRDVLFGYTLDYLYYDDIEEFAWSDTCSVLYVKTTQRLCNALIERHSFRTRPQLEPTPASFHECFSALDIDAACSVEEVISTRLPIASSLT